MSNEINENFKQITPDDLKILAAAKNLLDSVGAAELQEDVNDMYFAYLTTYVADDKHVRSRRTNGFKELTAFLQTMKTVPSKAFLPCVQ